jgi:hypothetical protein
MFLWITLVIRGLCREQVEFPGAVYRVDFPALLMLCVFVSRFGTCVVSRFPCAIDLAELLL